MNNSWLNRSLYPFESKFIEIENYKMHYIDEGQGEVILFVHGTPSWSFEYRHLIIELSKNYRCIACDHLGFGLSDKPAEIDYSVESQARRFESFVEKLDINKINLVLHDFGGPIGLNFARKQTEKIKSITLMNTWCWSFSKNSMMNFSIRLFENRFGKWFYINRNFSVNVMLKSGWGKHTELSQEIFTHYQMPFEAIESRHSTYALLKSLMGASAFYDNIFNDFYKFRSIPIMVLWGMGDKFFPAKQILAKWKESITITKIVLLEKSSHFPQESEPDIVIKSIRDFIK